MLDDAIHVYIRSRSEGYRAHLETARRFLDAPNGSDERALAGADLSSGLARDRGRGRQERGGDVAEVRARLRDQHVGGLDDALIGTASPTIRCAAGLSRPASRIIVVGSIV
ncbi:MAG: hypothetical protein ACRDGS_09980 [Chloroflexota bacterium]